MKSLQLDRPHAIIVIGIQGSGKTFFAEKFASTFNAPFIEQAMFDHAVSDEANAKALMTSMLKEMLKTGRSIVVELALPTKAERVDLTRQLKQAGYAPLYVWVQVDIETAIARSHRTSRITADEYRDRMRRFTPPHQNEHALVISGKHTFATQAKAVLRKLSGPRQTPEPPHRNQPPRGQIIVR